MSDQAVSVLKGAAIAAIGAVLTYAGQWLTGQDFGIYQPVAVVVLSVATNVFRKWANLP